MNCWSVEPRIQCIETEIELESGIGLTVKVRDRKLSQFITLVTKRFISTVSQWFTLSIREAPNGCAAQDYGLGIRGNGVVYPQVSKLLINSFRKFLASRLWEITLILGLVQIMYPKPLWCIALPILAQNYEPSGTRVAWCLCAANTVNCADVLASIANNTIAWIIY